MPVPGAVIPITYRFTARLAIRALQPGLLRSRGQKRENPAGLGRLYACHHFSLVFLLAFQYSPHSTPSHPICVFPCCTCMLVHSFSLAAASYLPTYLPTYSFLSSVQTSNKQTRRRHNRTTISTSAFQLSARGFSESSPNPTSTPLSPTPSLPHHHHHPQQRPPLRVILPIRPHL